ncbi:SdrD B-like domain-containing protein, partial [Aquimarina sp. RZ0]|uniref:DUF7507 domain-containing protein n=1 Tax=Aquimarina sp. RZ0 TaxID=2607730 RepID=UPI00125577E1
MKKITQVSLGRKRLLSLMTSFFVVFLVCSTSLLGQVRPTFNLSQGPTLLPGSNADGTIGARYIYQDIAVSSDNIILDAVLTINNIVDASVISVDTVLGVDDRFEPTTNTTAPDGFVEWQIEFVYDGTVINAADAGVRGILDTFSMEAIDVDGNEYFEVIVPSSYVIESGVAPPTELVVSTNGAFTKFQSDADFAPGIDVANTEYVVRVNYENIGIAIFRNGSSVDSNDRQNSISFLGEVTFDVTTPVVLNTPPTVVDNLNNLIVEDTNFSTNVLTGANDVDGNIDLSTTTLIDPNDVTNQGNVGTPLVIAGVGTYTVDAIGNLTFVPVSGYSGGADILFSVSDALGVSSERGLLGIFITIDTDGDLVSDDADQDDDNDGILDSNEGLDCPSSFINIGTAPPGNQNVAGVINDIYDFSVVNVDVTAVANTIDGGALSQLLVEDATSLRVQGQQIDNGIGETVVYTFTFSEPVTDLRFRWSGIDQGDRVSVSASGPDIQAINMSALTSPTAFPSNDYVNTSGGNSHVITNNNSLLPVITSYTNGSVDATLNYSDIIISGLVTSFDIITNKQRQDGDVVNNGDVTFLFSNLLYCRYIDSDGDNEPDHLDNDSDGDGCADAIEGNGIFTSLDIDTDGELMGGVGVDGVPTITGSPQANSSDVTLAGPDADGDGISDACDDLNDSDGDGIEDSSDICPNFDDNLDTDSDSVPDGCDQDSDNDGITDVDEGCENIVLVNNSFETFDPTTAQTTFGTAPSRAFYFNESDVSGWDTTASNNLVEIWETGHGGVTSIDGSAHAEINATQNAQLFQDFATTPGDIIQWSIWHRGRSGVDEARVLLGPSTGVLVEQRILRTNNTLWVNYKGFYTVPVGQTSTRIGFESVSTSNGGQFIGNFIDLLEIVACPDTDGDGDSDNLDTDSDGDGCEDAREGAGTFGAADIDGFGRLTGGVDAVGIPTVTGSPQGTTSNVIDASISTCTSMTGRLYIDTNNNGIQDNGEEGLGGVSVVITNTGGFSQTVTTFSDGLWFANSLPVGSLTVDINDADLPVGFTQTEGTDPSVHTAVTNINTFTENDGFFFPAMPDLHEAPSCAGTTYNFNWDTSSPNGINEFDWTPDGALTNTFTDIDGSGVDINYVFTGDTGTFDMWSGFGSTGDGPTPGVGPNADFGFENALQFFTAGYTATGITQTISFSNSLFSIGFDLIHVNGAGANGDKFTVTATDGLGNTIFPTFTNSGTPSYASDNTTGIINATALSTDGDNDRIGVNFEDIDGITSITILWQDCDTCTIGNRHGSAIGGFDFCTEFPDPSLSVIKTVRVSGSVLNDVIEYDIVVTNTGNVTLSAIEITDDNADAGSISGSPIVSLLPGASATVTA